MQTKFTWEEREYNVLERARVLIYKSGLLSLARFKSPLICLLSPVPLLNYLTDLIHCQHDKKKQMHSSHTDLRFLKHASSFPRQGLHSICFSLPNTSLTQLPLQHLGSSLRVLLPWRGLSWPLNVKPSPTLSSLASPISVSWKHWATL